MTYLGGSLMPPEVVEAMRQASESYVDLNELQDAVGRRIAELTRNEAAFVSGGAAAGLFLSAIVCMSRDTAEPLVRPTDLDGMPREFLIQRGHRIPYDPAIELAGGRLVEIGAPPARRWPTWKRDRTGYCRRSSTSPAPIWRAERSRSRWSSDRARPRHPGDRRRSRPTAAGREPVADSPAPAPTSSCSAAARRCPGRPAPGLVLGRARYVGRFAALRGPTAADRPADEGRQGGPHRDPRRGRVVPRAGPRGDRPSPRGDGRPCGGLGARSLGRERRARARGRGRPADTPRPSHARAGPCAAAGRRSSPACAPTPPRIALLPAGEDGFYLAPETLVPGEEAVVTSRLAEILAR